MSMKHTLPEIWFLLSSVTTVVCIYGFLWCTIVGEYDTALVFLVPAAIAFRLSDYFLERL